ncbi:carboxy terminal-processing peptidase [Sansalvadorimonas sp. 2012CJ34-2]|uniref:Carboxy terminal-processing peptidase n=1 Tax=Parendozoicomonas callyspongiae TaxID=2942213 RepID=A0ABT0PFQ0_9GAMM|nr:carboxy terminal-processing peptidase [Sansalvadorimonas sp. 2012CJ34-2]MCL6270199.1 carboxy terminal-processing peptidase [Sansalvadorimonas sp. 2012CJ34-2]
MRFSPRFINPRLFATIAFCVLATLGRAAEDLDQQPAKLKPTLNQAIASVNVVQLLKSHSYEKLNLNGSSSEKIFDSYLDTLDRNRSFFLASDIKEFNKYKDGLDDALKGGNLNPAFEIFNRYRQRSEERIRFMLKLVEDGLDKLDFKKNETLEIDREKSPWLKDTAEQEDLWRRQMKDSVLAMKLNDKPMKEISELLTKRYTNQLRRLHQTRSEDAFQLYLNAYTQLYDPHTQYFSPQRAENFDINMSLSLEGIGAVLQSEDEYTKVISIVPAGPADKAGQLKPGDKIIGVAQGQDGKMEDVVGMRLDEVVKLIRGTKGTVVKLEVIPSGASDGKNRTYPITRDKVKLEEQSAQKDIIEIGEGKNKKRIGIIDIPAFYIDFKAAQAGEPDYKSTTRDVRKLIKELQKKNIDGLVIDLRNNGGGSLQEANQLTGLFIPDGPTVVVKDNRGRIEAQKDPDPKEVYGGPMVVLINRLSASASEIFAGAMQDYQRALIVGGQSFGKGTVQTIQPLNHGQLKLTIAKFYRVSGQSTQNRGIIPDISYPSIFDPKEIGESSLTNALPYSEIRPVAYKAFKPLTSYVPGLQKAHDQRTEDNPDFLYLDKLREYQKLYDGRTEVQLNEKKRTAEIKEMRDRRLAIENELRRSKGEKLYKNLEELEEEQNSRQGQTNKDRNSEEDAILVETSHILSDLIMQKRPMVARNLQEG